jgi:hypothetical protein
VCPDRAHRAAVLEFEKMGKLPPGLSDLAPDGA